MLKIFLNKVRYSQSSARHGAAPLEHSVFDLFIRLSQDFRFLVKFTGRRYKVSAGH